MPFVGNVANTGTEQVSNTQTTRNQTLVVADNVAAETRPLDVSGMSRVTILVNQTTGQRGTVQLLVRTQGNAPNIAFPAIAIGALGVPMWVAIPISARSAILRVTGGPAGGPHTFQCSVQVAAAAGT